MEWKEQEGAGSRRERGGEGYVKIRVNEKGLEQGVL